jgi:hypothetical protein
MKNSVSIEKSIWLGPDGYVDIDEEWQSNVKDVKWEDPDVKALIKQWRALGRLVNNARYHGIEAYAMLDRKDESSQVFLKVCFFHPGPGLGIDYLPKKQVLSIRKRARGLIAILKKQGFECEPMEPTDEFLDDALTDYWVNLDCVKDFGILLDSLVRLSIEFGLLEYLWQPVEE